MLTNHVPNSAGVIDACTIHFKFPSQPVPVPRNNGLQVTPTHPSERTSRIPRPLVSQKKFTSLTPPSSPKRKPTISPQQTDSRTRDDAINNHPGNCSGTHYSPDEYSATSLNPAINNYPGNQSGTHYSPDENSATSSNSALQKHSSKIIHLSTSSK